MEGGTAGTGPEVNGPAYVVLVMLLGAGVFMLITALVRYRQQPGRWTQAETRRHATLTVLWVAAIVLLVLTTEPGDQPKLSLFVGLVAVLLAVTGTWNLLRRCRPEIGNGTSP